MYPVTRSSLVVEVNKSWGKLYNWLKRGLFSYRNATQTVFFFNLAFAFDKILVQLCRICLRIKQHQSDVLKNRKVLKEVEFVGNERNKFDKNHPCPNFKQKTSRFL